MAQRTFKARLHDAVADPAHTDSPPGPRLHGLPEPLRLALDSRQLPGLNGVRAICAGLVVFYHLGVPRVPGGYGVLAFFVLSGFLITWLMLHEDRAHGRVSLKAFYVRRSLRIFPAFYAYWIAAVGVWWLANRYASAKPVDWGQAVASLTYTTNYFQALVRNPDSVLSHTWSLAIEEQFYLLWPLGFLVLGRRWRAVGLVAGIVAVTLHRQQLYWLHGNENWAYEAFDGRADHLLYGCLLAVALWEGRWQGLWRRVCTPWAMLLTALTLVVSTQLGISVHGYRNVVGFTVDPVLTSLLIVQAMASRDWRGARWLHHRWMETLGSWSYSTYLYQQLAIGFASRLPVGVGLLFGVAFTYGCAGASYRFIERPFLLLKSRFRRVD
jgi:peptidoglycan/LPS O-acetylase OafA/YrhL